VAGRHDPRRRAAAVNPLAPFDRNDPCWCASGHKYKHCHMIRGLSPAGAPVPDDTADSVFISPDTSVAKAAFASAEGPVTVTVQQPTPQAVPVRVDDAVRALAATAAADEPMTHADLGRLRYGILEVHGLADADALRAGRRDSTLRRVIPDIARGTLALARETVDRLATDAASGDRPVTLRLDAGNVSRFVGQTLFWADHYLAHDDLAGLAVSENDDADAWRRAIGRLLEVRPLVEAGLVVPVLDELAVAAVDAAINGVVADDLRRTDYVRWAEQQIVIEGPTAREAAFVHVVDDYAQDGWFYLLNRVVPCTAEDGSGTVESTGRLLNRYDPAEDYAPWLSTVRRQAVAELTKRLDTDLVVAEALGADLVTSSPFRARALRRRAGYPQPSGDYNVSGAVWADVPWLPDAPPELLIKIASSDPRVEDLRRATSAALRTAADDDLASAAQAIADAAAELRAAGQRLGAGLRSQTLVNGAVSAGLSVGSVLVGGTVGAPLAASGVLAGAAALLPAFSGQVARRGTAPYAFWMARPRRRVGR
jgi:SEC-C motif